MDNVPDRERSLLDSCTQLNAAIEQAMMLIVQMM